MINENKDFIMIDFTGLFKTIFMRLWIVILAGAICAGGAVFYARYKQRFEAYTPMYQSTAKLYMTGNYTSSLSVNGKTLGQSIVTDYYELMKSRKVLEQVINDLGLNMSNGELYSCTSIRLIPDTCMVYFSVVFPDPVLSKEIVDALLMATSAYAIEIMNMAPPVVYEEAQVPKVATNVYSSVDTKTYILYGVVAGAGISLLLIVVIFLLDGKFRTARQIKSRTSLPVLSALINYKNHKGVKYNRNAIQNLFGQIYAIKKECKMITFLSAEKEDKMELIKSFAFSLTQMKKKVIVLDAGLTYTIGKNGNRLEEYLINNTAKLNNAIFHEDDIDVLDNEEPVSNAVELLSSDRFRKLISELREKYDYILVNTTPTEYAADASPVLEYADACIVVIEIGRTKLTSYDRLFSKYSHDSKLTGIVVANVKLKKRSKEFQSSFGKYMGII